MTTDKCMGILTTNGCFQTMAIPFGPNAFVKVQVVVEQRRISYIDHSSFDAFSINECKTRLSLHKLLTSNK